MWGKAMTIEKKRLSQRLGVPDLKLREIVEEQRLLDAASRWPILNDVVHSPEPARRKVAFQVADTPETDTVDTQPAAGRAASRARPSPRVLDPDTREELVIRSAKAEPVPSNQLSNVFLRLKHRDRPKADKPETKRVSV